MKSKWVICLTERTFIDKTEDRYDVDSELEIYLQFFVDWCCKNKMKTYVWRVKKILKILVQKCLEQKIID